MGGGNQNVLSRTLSFLLVVVLALISVALGTADASANHRYDTYRNRGYIWFAEFNDNAIAWTTSDNCNPRELEAYNRVEATTVGEFPVRWPSGIHMGRDYTHPCD